ncbi:MAG: hypothetical protein RLY16_107, partial [Bacteroidota bacterium]
MSFAHVIRTIRKNLIWLILIPSVLASTIFYFTRNEKKVYGSETIIYTGIASGYSLSGNNKADFFTTSNAFDNLLSLINSRETKQEVVIDLLAEHLAAIDKHDPAILAWGSWDQLRKSIPDSVKKRLLGKDFAGTKKAIKDYMDQDENSWVFKLINSAHPYYSIDALNKVKSLRISMSDLIKISYETNDAAICKRTLELLVQEFMHKHRFIKEGQTESVVKYFEDETKKAFSRLDSNEAVFLNFNKTNDIINYYEQTRSLAGEKELLYAQNHNLEMDRQADSKTLEKVNQNLEGRVYKILNGTNIIKDREKLSEVYNQLAVTEVLNKEKDAATKKRVDSLNAIAKGLEKNLQGSMDKLYAESNTPNGIPTRSVLDEWLKTTLAYEQSKAKLTVMDKRKREFVEEYRKFAPLGAMLKKIERQIGVSEKEYLELLHGLSMARLTQQNNELTTKLTIVDAPFLPLSPNASKRMVMVIAGFAVGFILVLATLLAKALSEKSIQQPAKVKKAVGYPVLAIYPLLNEKKYFIERSNLRLIQKVLSRMDVNIQPFVFAVVSAQKGEGKSMLNELLHQELLKLNYKVEKIQWQLGFDEKYKPETEVVLLEIPTLNDLAMKPGGMPKIDQTLLVCRANRIWSKVDTELLSIFTKVTATEPLVILNGVEDIFAHDYIGNKNRPKSKFQRFIARIKSLNPINKLK